MPSATTAVPTIKVDGRPLADSADVIALSVRRGLNSTGHARIRFDDAENAPEVRPGNDIAISILDHEGAAATVFEGTVVGIGLEFETDRKQLVVDVYDGAHRLSAKVNIESYIEQRIDDVIRRLAESVGLQLQGGTGDRTVFDQLPRWGTAEAVITELCRATGSVWYVEGRTLHVRQRGREPAVILSGDRDLRSFTSRFNTVGRVDDVTVRGWDAVRKEAVVGTATRRDVANPTVNGVADSKPDKPPSATVWSRFVSDQTSAKLIANRAAARMRATEHSARGEALVDPRITPGSIVTIENVASDWNGDYFVTAVEHLFGRRQTFVTRFHVGDDEPDSLAGLLGGDADPSGGWITAGLTIGIVTANDSDPLGMSRVKVKLPYLSNDLEVGWARVVSPGAGRRRGMLAMPEVDDEVLVGFEHGDARRPYVLGGLWNGVDPTPDATSEVVDNGSVATRSFTTRLGHRMAYYDDHPTHKNSIVIELGNKSVKLRLHETDGIEIAHADDVPIKLTSQRASIVLDTGGDIVLKGTNIVLEAQGDVKLTANGSLTASANATASMSGRAKAEVKGAAVDVAADGVATVKGAMVKVN